MGRPRTKKTTTPLPCFHKSHGAYFFVKKGVWHPLGRDLPNALAEYARRVEGQKDGRIDLAIDEAFGRMKKRVAHPLKPNTIAQYAIAAKKLKHHLRAFAEPGHVRQKDAAALKRHLASTPNMANRVISFARMIWADMLEEQMVGENPFAAIRRHAEAKRTRTYAPAEWEAIYTKAGPRLQVIMDLLYYTDRRIGDVLKIGAGDLIRHEAGIYFREQKTGKELVVRWTPELRAVVERAKTLHGNVRALTLLHNRRGKAPDYRTVANQWRTACKAAGVADAHLHDVRAMAATDVKRQRGKLAAQAVLNHTEESTTNTYMRGLEIPIVDGPSRRTA